MQKEFRSAFHPRQYMLTRDFEVFYYSDLNFQNVGLHSHDYYEIYFFVEGAVEMDISGSAYPLTPGDMIVVPPGTPHQVKILDGERPYRRFVLWLSREYWDRLEKSSSDYTYLLRHTAEHHRYIYPFDAIRFNAIYARLFSLLDEIHADRFGREECISLLVRELMLHLSRAVYERTHPGGPKENRSTYAAITGFIDTHLEEDLTLDRLSREFYISKYYIAHLFQDSTGLSVHQYITKKRLAACCAAIQSGTAISAAYRMCGFRDYSSFYRAFQKEYGMPPSKYREIYMV